MGLDGTPVFDRAGGTSVLPASNMKIVTAAVALDVLGAEHRFTTEALADASPVGGVVNGNLYLVGGGDPVLGTAPYVAAAAAQVTHPQPYVTPLEALADQIVATGCGRSRARSSATTAGTTRSASCRRGPSSYADVEGGRSVGRADGQRLRGLARPVAQRATTPRCPRRPP